MMEIWPFRLIVIIGLFFGVFLAFALLHRLKPSWLAAQTSTRYDLIIALVIGILGTSAWLSRDAHVKAAYHRWYHDTEWGTTVQDTYWLGSPLLKTPLDMWIYQEIMYQTRPTVIVETGTWRGGSAKYFGSIFDLIGEPSGRIITVDIEKFSTPENPRATYLIGSSTSPEILRQIRSLIHPEDKVMVSLDSDHSEEHVFEELRFYSDLVTPGQYLVVEDTHLNGNPIRTGVGDPYAAVLRFLEQDDRFEADRSREKFGLTFNPNGWLRRLE